MTAHYLEALYLAESFENAIAQTFCPAHVRVGSKSENNTALIRISASSWSNSNIRIRVLRALMRMLELRDH